MAREPKIDETDEDAERALPAGRDDTAGTGVFGDMPGLGATTRRRPRRLLWWILLPAGAAAVAAGVTAALVTESASRTPTPFAVVTSALAKTSAVSYSFTIQSETRFKGRQITSDVVYGAVDVRHRRGTELVATPLRKSPVTAHIRFVGAYVYTQVSGLAGIGKPWNKAPLPSVANHALLQPVYGFVSDWPVSPAEFAEVLQSAGRVRDDGPASGPGWTGARYTLSATFPGQATSVTATVYIDQQGRVRRLVTITRQDEFTIDRNLAFRDFGAPVPVTAPASSTVRYTSRPYWGFLF